MIELGKRAVASPHWVWGAGMWAIFSETCKMYCSDEPPYIKGQSAGMVMQGAPTLRTTKECGAPMVPDFREPTTMGCLLHLVREAWGDPDISVQCSRPIAPDMSGRRGGWIVIDGKRRLVFAGRHTETEAEALVAALEAAPKRGEA